MLFVNFNQIYACIDRNHHCLMDKCIPKKKVPHEIIMINYYGKNVLVLKEMNKLLYV